ncbi:hypothetical protein H257_12413 [Aphanomyces astaci]|uniref:Uncharacterized protein n=1 Tax=Aphanomyces astaci TaxID=112090 RepID=W4G174_APHAT|nr:hypothetical protein H257_12413 [Aphanomyces astaci]ETV72668.1 hypothetical protein H257_12413 [Aphanomyces astaci]|eukprot:XP_009837896.1 hypothetical protein H257_12413 [Aphanomyces astaci]
MRELHDSVDQDAKRLTNDKHKHLVRPCLGSKRQASFTLAKAILFDGEPSTSMKSQWKGGNEAAINPTKYLPTHRSVLQRLRCRSRIDMNNGGSDNDVSCSVSASASPAAAPRSGDSAVANNRRETHHEVFGDGNLNMVMLVVILVHLMQYMMRAPCTC